MKIKVLMDNLTSDKKYKAEHGLSMYIETKKHNILFDTGASEAIFDNAKTLGIDLRKVDILVISHGHSDHGGGLKKFLDMNIRAKVYVNENAFGNFYNAAGEYIGLDKELAESGRILKCSDESVIDNEVWLFTANDEERAYPFDTFGLTEEIDGEKKPDRFLHEQYMMIKEETHSILFTGCSHKGIFNIMNSAEVKANKPLAVIGGFHFMNVPVDTEEGKAFLNESAKRLCEHSAYYFTCHCTGEEQYKYLKGKMGPKLKYLAAGQELKI